MSGGSHDYIYCKIDEYLCGQMHDPVMDEMMEDNKKVAHDLEWWESSDISEETYRETVAAFKQKWLNGGCTDVLKKIIRKRVEADVKFLEELSMDAEGKLTLKLKLTDIAKPESIPEIDLTKIVKPENLQCTRMYPNPGVELLKRICSIIESRMIQVQTRAQLAEDTTQFNILKVRLSELNFVHDVLDDFMMEAESGHAEQD